MQTVPVVIAGGGPVGMILAHDLARRGIRCLIAERNATTTRHPKMDITNGRSMELLRRGGLDKQLRAVAISEEHGFDVSWITSLAGHQLHRFTYPTVAQKRADIAARNDGTQTAEPAMRVSQVVIEPVLKAAIDKSPLVDVRFGWALESFSADETGVMVELKTEQGTVEQVRAQYLVGCDGGSSRVRRLLDINLSGEARIGERAIVHFESDDLACLQRWGATWHYQTNLGTLVAQDDRRIWTLLARLTPGRSTDPADLLEGFAGQPVAHRLLVTNPWSPNLLVADSYGRGRVLIAGDAAHQYVPTGGYGMNTGVGDAYDLAWKLAALLHGFGGPALLASYEAERRPIGIRNCAASRRHVDVRLQIGALYEPELDGEIPQAEALRASVSRQIAAIGNAENESWGIEHGYGYADSPIVAVEPGAELPDDPLVYEPTTLPGVRLPSIILDDGVALYDLLGDWFTLLLVGREDDGGFRLAAAERGVPLKIVSIAAHHAGIYDAPMLVIRPDQHIAWRGKVGNPTDAAAVLRRATGWM